MKTCSCGKRYDEASWAALPLVGALEDEAYRIEFRNCTCGSTIAVELPKKSKA